MQAAGSLNFLFRDSGKNLTMQETEITTKATTVAIAVDTRH